jgi:hypothetical protein
LLQWIPDYEGIRGSGRANELAQEPAEAISPMSDPVTKISILAKYAKAKVIDSWPKSDW